MLSAHCPRPDPLALPSYLDIEELQRVPRKRERDGRGESNGRRPTQPHLPPKTHEPEEA